MSNDQLFSYEAPTGELHSVPEAFLARDGGVLSIVWNIEQGAVVAPGDEIGTLQWDDNQRQAVIAPANCSGSVVAINGDLVYERLALPPSQWLLRLS